MTFCQAVKEQPAWWPEEVHVRLGILRPPCSSMRPSQLAKLHEPLDSYGICALSIAISAFGAACVCWPPIPLPSSQIIHS